MHDEAPLTRPLLRDRTEGVDHKVGEGRGVVRPHCVASCALCLKVAVNDLGPCQCRAEVCSRLGVAVPLIAHKEPKGEPLQKVRGELLLGVTCEQGGKENSVNRCAGWLWWGLRGKERVLSG